MFSYDNSALSFKKYTFKSILTFKININECLQQGKHVTSETVTISVNFLFKMLRIKVPPLFLLLFGRISHFLHYKFIKFSASNN